MKENSSKVSIIIPLYNADDFLEGSFNSALNQSYPNIEIILVNDGSKQRAIFDKLKFKYKKFNKIIFIDKKKNEGVSKALNAGIKKAKGEYISWLSHDDLYLKDKIKKQIKLIKEIENSIICCNFISRNQKNEKKITLFYHIYSLIFSYTFCLLFDDKLHGCSLLIKRKDIEKVGLFNSSLKHIQDYDLWLRLADSGLKIVNDHTYNLVSNHHLDQTSKKKYDEAFFERNSFYINYFKLNLKRFNYLERLFLLISFWKRGYKNISNYIFKNFII